MDYGAELKKYPDLSDEDKKDLEKLAGLQKDVAIGGTAEDFIRHPFFKVFENHLNDVINDSKGSILKVTTLEELKVFQARIEAITEVKKWINSFVIKGRVGKQAIDLYEEETADMNEKIQAAVEKAQVQS